MTAISRARHAAPAREVERRPDLTVVRRRRARRSMLTRLGTVMLFALFVSVLGVVVFQTLRVQNQAKLDDINKRIATEQDATKELRLKLADAQAPDRIANAARTRLGMIPPNDIAYLQPKADDDAKGAWDPVKDPVPAPPTTVAPEPTVPPTTVPPVATPAPRSAGASGTGAAKSSGTGTAKSTGSSTPTAPAKSSTPTTAKTTTPTTAKPTTPTTTPKTTGKKP